MRVPITPLTIQQATDLLARGELVALPTETVYGLGADAENGKAVARIYETKQRPEFNPLITHIHSASWMQRYAKVNDAAMKLAERFWPGPLTLVLPRAEGCALSELVSAGGNTAALRVPSHPAMRAVLEAFGRGIAAPSANRSGRVSPTRAEHVEEEFGNALKLILDGGPCALGIESTVVELSADQPVILRHGSVTKEALEGVIGHCAEAGAEIPIKSPGQMRSHYAPSLPVRLNATEIEPGEVLLAFGPLVPPGAARVLNLSPGGDLREAAANLFAYLRALDMPEAQAIAIMPIPGEGLGRAINDRLWRAAQPR